MVTRWARIRNAAVTPRRRNPLGGKDLEREGEREKDRERESGSRPPPSKEFFTKSADWSSRRGGSVLADADSWVVPSESFLDDDTGEGHGRPDRSAPGRHGGRRRAEPAAQGQRPPRPAEPPSSVERGTEAMDGRK